MSAGVAVVEAGLEGAEGVFTTGGGLVGAAPQMLGQYSMRAYSREVGLSQTHSNMNSVVTESQLLGCACGKEAMPDIQLHHSSCAACDLLAGVLWFIGATVCGVNVLPRSEAQLLASRKVQRSKDRPTKPIQSNK